MAGSYIAGAVVRLSATFTANGVATDPTTITLFVRNAQNIVSQYTYAGAQVIRDSAGAFHYDLTVSSSGSYAYRYVAGGAVVAAAEGSFQATSLGFV